MSWASHAVHGSVVFHDRRWVDGTLRFIICFRTSVWMGTSLRSSRVWMTFISGRIYFLLIHQRHYCWMLKYWEQRNHSIIYYSITKETTINPISYLLDNRSFVWHDLGYHCQKHALTLEELCQGLVHLDPTIVDRNEPTKHFERTQLSWTGFGWQTSGFNLIGWREPMRRMVQCFSFGAPENSLGIIQLSTWWFADQRHATQIHHPSFCGALAAL